MSWLEITALEDIGGALWVKSPGEEVLLGSGFDWIDPTRLIEYVEEHVRPEVRYVSKKQ
jgi:hypothetical protein